MGNIPNTNTPNLVLQSVGNGSNDSKWGASGAGGFPTASGTGSMVYWNGTAWVSTVTPVTNDAYKWNGSSWVNTSISGGGLTGNDAGRVYATSATTLINGTNTAIGFNSTSYSNGAMSTSGSGLTTGTAGIYNISGCVSITPSAGITDFQVFVTLGGSEAIVSALSGLLSGDQTSLVVSGDFNVGSGVTIGLSCYQSSGANRTNTTGSVYTWLTAHLVSI